MIIIINFDNDLFSAIMYSFNRFFNKQINTFK